MGANHQVHARPMRSLDDYCGIYRHSSYGRLTIERSGDGLVAVLTTVTCPLRYFGLDQFELCLGFKRGAWLLQFQFAQNGHPCSFHLKFGTGVEDLIFTRDE